ncbi:uncharacterized protein BDZ99DRAFT_473232 [Mytilinidion resinicola]|uniref:Uncharacterized protein n=1 Tax=Mytilinidion resinicola TaxID=574789 RepID=A0A6A6Z012_9PEZI|nr:uncharacterized protein BDZ99DRAFT_473232 [Mytilinidion resinicola]KAF2814118.1 hypothetical protein BDZ99DRAFT_473232 [Mytilinidion resinicola]
MVAAARPKSKNSDDQTPFMVVGPMLNALLAGMAGGAVVSKLQGFAPENGVSRASKRDEHEDAAHYPKAVKSSPSTKREHSLSENHGKVVRKANASHSSPYPNSRRPRSFQPGEGIAPEVITADIQRYLGNDASVEQVAYQDSRAHHSRQYHGPSYLALAPALAAYGSRASSDRGDGDGGDDGGGANGGSGMGDGHGPGSKSDWNNEHGGSGDLDPITSRLVAQMAIARLEGMQHAHFGHGSCPRPQVSGDGFFFSGFQVVQIP